MIDTTTELQKNTKSALISRGGTRKPYIDVLRAMAMLFVIYGHVVTEWTAYFVFTSPIKISLFFAITGYVFNDSRTTKDFYINIVRKLIIPWIVLGMSVTVVLTPFKGMTYFFEHLRKLLMGETLWYMPCCIIAEIIWYNVLKFCKKERWVITASVALFTIGLLMGKYSILNVCMINVACVVQLYIIIGYLYKKYESKFYLLNIWTIVPGITLFVILGIVTIMMFPGQCLDIHLNRYFNIPICLAMILLGCTLAFYIVSKASRYPKFLIYIGQNTLVIYIFHGYILQILKTLCPMCGIDFQNKIIAVIITLLTCAICCCTAWVINTFIPEVIGKKRVKK